MLDKEIVRLKVTGEFACFTRPDLKVERMSYPCMTPSAARGILEAILWRPEFQWFIRRIIILNPIKFCSVKRNEIQWKNTRKGNPIDISDIKNRVQRNSIVLKDVAYIIEASVFVKEELLSQRISGKPPITVKKYREMFERRVRNGQCWHQPCLGTREFAADFFEPDEKDVPFDITYPIGSMLYDMYYDDKGNASPEYFYDVSIKNGVLECPLEKATKLLSSSHFRHTISDEYNRVVYNHYQEEEADL